MRAPGARDALSGAGARAFDPAAAFWPAAGTPGAVLLETQRPRAGERYSFLFRDPVRILSAAGTREVPALLAEAGEWQAQGHPVAGYLSYEAGFALDPAFDGEADPPPQPFPLLWMCVYEGCLRYDHLLRRWSSLGRSTPGWAPFPAAEGTDPPCDDAPPAPRFAVPEDEYREKVERIRAQIAQGRVYQANLTGKFVFPFPGDPFSLYLRLRAAQPVPYGAFLRTEQGCIVSQSPELFFRVRGERIEARPMKGTAARGLTRGEDRSAAEALRRDPKNRAENVMIVDLLRNDLGRICRPGSIRAARLFEVQRYRTVLQMVSTVTGRLARPQTPLSVFRALFPCGSVTGAPKISAMRLLRGLEEGPRGVYTGAVGALLPGGDMAFSVAIRTVTVRDGRAEAGAGGGIVWDSEPGEEFREAQQKGRYLVEPPSDFRLIETFLLAADGTFRFLADHLRRLAASAGYFGFPFRREAILSALREAARREGPGGVPRKVRLLLGRRGEPEVEVSPMPGPRGAGESLPLRVAFPGVAFSSRDPFTRHKTTRRERRDEELRKARAEGFDEVLFLNERGELTEGAISNLFVELSGRLFTPPASCGLLEGVFRRRLLRDRSPRASERILRPEDLAKADKVFLTNSVRGMRPAVVSGRAHGSEPG
jgi:para-aminobenzoate synthetase / 4-amino-4-deoxychorismate lyase